MFKQKPLGGGDDAKLEEQKLKSIARPSISDVLEKQEEKQRQRERQAQERERKRREQYSCCGCSC